MSVLVVVPFKPVQITHNNHKTLVAPLKPDEFSLDLLHKIAPVGQPSESVMVGQLLKPGISDLQLPFLLLKHGLGLGQLDVPQPEDLRLLLFPFDLMLHGDLFEGILFIPGHQFRILLVEGLEVFQSMRDITGLFISEGYLFLQVAVHLGKIQFLRQGQGPAVKAEGTDIPPLVLETSRKSFQVFGDGKGVVSFMENVQGPPVVHP